jgi:hypothetical protein
MMRTRHRATPSGTQRCGRCGATGASPSTSVLDGALRRSVPAKAVPKPCPQRRLCQRARPGETALGPTDAANTTERDIEAAREPPLHCRYAGKASSPLGADLAGLHVCGCRSCRGAALTAKPERGAGQRQFWWYSSSVTCSPRLASGRWPPGTASVVAWWVMMWPGVARCQCRSPAGVQMISPTRISPVRLPRGWWRLWPSVRQGACPAV